MIPYYARTMTTLHNHTVISPTLIGREGQLALLTDRLTHTHSGQSRIALIAGEAGIGKSRLVAEVKALAAQRGVRSVQGHCFEQDSSFPYAPLIDLLRAFCVGRSAEALTRALAETASELVKIFPELSSYLPNLTPTPAFEPEQEKRRLFQAFTQFLHQLTATDQPLLIVFEDLHWCDETSLDWLLAFVRKLTTQPLLVLLTYRNDEVHPTLKRLLAAFDRLPLVSEVGLAPLTRADVDTMLRAIFALDQPPQAEFIDTLHALTDGNPLFIEEVLKALIASGDIYQQGDVWTRKPLHELQIPRTVQVAVQQRTRHLRDAAQRLLTLAAVIGQRFDFDTLQAVAQQPESELLRQLKELIAAQLVIEESDETFAFRHALTHRAIYAALLARERKTLHGAVAVALEREDEDALSQQADRLAHHCYQAGQWAKALRWAQQAGDHARRLSAHGEALIHYTRARACAAQLGQAEQVAALDHTLGQVYRLSGQFPQAIEAFTRALDATPEAAHRAALKAELGEAYLGIADEQALVFLRQAIDELDPSSQAREIARATLWLGRYWHLRAQYRQAVTYLEHAHRLIEPLGDAATLRFIYQYLTAASLFSGRFAQSIDWSERLIAHGEAHQILLAITIGYWYRSFNALGLGQWQDAEAYTSRGMAYVQTLVRQSGVQDGWANIPLVYAAYYQGNLASGIQLARSQIALSIELRDRRGMLYVNRMLVMLKTARGAEQLAYEAGELALRDGDELIEVTIRCWNRIALAGLHMQREEWPQALALYEQCAALLVGTEHQFVRMELGGLMAEAYCAQGQHSKAAALLAETLELTRASGARHYEAVAWRVQGQLYAVQGQAAPARQAFDQAIAICEELGSRVELAYALYQRGALLRSRQKHESARADWTRARTLCEQTGAHALLWRIHAALGQLARAQHQDAEAAREFAAARTIVADLSADMHDESFREHLAQRVATLIPAEPRAVSRRTLKAAFGGLTERERAVAALIAQGRSNREIAEALVVSERTITTHISNIFTKLGFTSRAQVARWAGETGLIERSIGGSEF
jgi:DNA-binding CsgD family transcriptional regulator/tetratricopeptide (TPR) repeat protein